jgi:WD40 repeat protein
MLNRSLLQLNLTGKRLWILISLILISITIYASVIAPTLSKQEAHCRWNSLPSISIKNLEIPIEPGELETITVSNLNQLRQLAVIDLPGYLHGGYRTTFNPDGTFLAISGSSDVYGHVTTLLWDFMETESCVGIINGSNDEHFIAFSPKGDILLTRICLDAINHKCYHVWNVADLSLIADFEYAEFVRFPDGNMLSYRNIGEQQRHLWNMEQPGSIGTTLTSFAANARLFSPDNSIFVTTSQDGTISLWNTDSNAKVGDRFSGFANPIASESVQELIFAPNGEWLAFRSGQIVGVIETETQELHISLEARYSAYDFTFTSDSRWFAYGGAIWDVALGDVVFDLSEGIFSGFNVDESFLVVISNNNAEFLSADTGGLLLTLDTEKDVKHVTHSSNGKLIAIAVSEQQGPYSYGYVELWGIPLGNDN